MSLGQYSQQKSSQRWGIWRKYVIKVGHLGGLPIERGIQTFSKLWNYQQWVFLTHQKTKLETSWNIFSRWCRLMSWSGQTDIWSDYKKSTWHLLVQNWPWKSHNNMWNLFKVNNRDTKTMSMISFWCLYQLWTDSKHCSGISIVKFE